jgi:hypothetical protein
VFAAVLTNHLVGAVCRKLEITEQTLELPLLRGRDQERGAARYPISVKVGAWVSVGKGILEHSARVYGCEPPAPIGSSL